MLNRIAVSRITNCDVLTRKGPITLKVYIEDGTSEIIPNFKASDLHLSEWREVMKACPNRTGKGWATIYKQIGTRMDYWNGYLTKRRKTKQKQQNRTRGGKVCEDEAQSKSSQLREEKAKKNIT
ncbi:hypothetical protein Tco_0499186 [Tanacetum coccineum]